MADVALSNLGGLGPLRLHQTGNAYADPTSPAASASLRSVRRCL